MADNASPAATVRRNDSARRYELEVDGHVAGFIDYRDSDGARQLVHTEVDAAHEGKGYAAQLAQHALDDVRDAGLKVVPACSYVARYIDRHPAYTDLLVS
ncbi:MAG: N-acetyltransferase [Comamonadaceae bacterium]|nr:MAG: N-acetyltransferase [Comamonadaceae bacterium]